MRPKIRANHIHLTRTSYYKSCYQSKQEVPRSTFFPHLVIMARQEGCVSSKALSPSGDPSLLLTSSSQAVRFLLEPSTTFVETSWKTSHRISTKMSTHSDIFPREQVTDTMLAEAANLFSENYGTWGKHSHSPGMQQMLLYLCLSLTPFQESQ